MLRNTGNNSQILILIYEKPWLFRAPRLGTTDAGISSNTVRGLNDNVG